MNRTVLVLARRVDELALYSLALGASGDTPLIATTLERALEAARRTRVDGVLVDCDDDLRRRAVSPEVVAALRGAPALAGVPIVVVTGDARAETLQGLREAGADAALPKPAAPMGLVRLFSPPGGAPGAPLPDPTAG